MSARLPIIIAMLASLAIIGTASYARFAPRESTTTATTATLSSALGATIADLDSDSDGLKDWEETLWGTDPKNPDTDEDGTEDGKEVAAGRNPATKGDGSDDRLSTDLYSGSNIASTATSSEPTTATDRFSRDFFARYLSLKSSGQQLSVEEQTAIIDEMIASERRNLAVPALSLGDLTVSDSTTLKAYGNALGAISKARSGGAGVNQLAIITEAISSNDETKLALLRPIQQNYLLIISDLRKTPAPRSIIDAHLTLVNALVLIENGMRAMTDVTIDPLTAIARTQFYFDGIASFEVALDNLRSLFIRTGVTFSPSDDGYELFGGI